MTKYLSASGLIISALVMLIVLGVLLGIGLTEQRTETAIRNNFGAAGLLSRLQVEGEKMRRFEKEMFIYVADKGKRVGYVKDFDAAHIKMLTLLDTTLAPSSRAFTNEERAELMKWKEAAVFYTNEFSKLVMTAERIDTATMTPEQRATLTVDYNGRIKEGKDRFRELLVGAEKLRALKEEQALVMAGEINAIFNRLRAGLLLGGLALIALTLYTRRKRSRPIP